MSLRWTFLVGALVSASVTGCAPQTDLGKECTLVRKNTTGSGPPSIFIKESEIVPGKDFISFGATECEDLVCVRNADAPIGSDPTADAKGKCSRPCLETNAASCQTGDDKVDQSDQNFVCRAMLLDTETLAAIKEADPARYKQYFGDTTSPYFCAHPVKQQ